jgi:uncharacterized protein (DUF433 family)
MMKSRSSQFSRSEQYGEGNLATRIAPLDPLRFQTPLYSVSEVARYLGLPRRTLGYWAKGNGTAVISTIPTRVRSHHPVVPFVGLTEAFVAATFRRVHGLSLQYIRKALASIQQTLGLKHALASQMLYTDGAKILADEGDDEETMLLIEVVSNNVVFTEVVRDYLKRIEYAADGWAQQLVLPTPKPVAIVNPYRAYGQPLTIRGGARIVDLLDRFHGGENPAEIAEDFAVPEPDILEIVRAYYQATTETA